MKNIHILPTDKPSRLHLYTDENGTRLALCELEYSHTRNTQNIYITSDEEIKEGDYCWDENKQKVKRYFQKREAYPSLIHRFKIILTTDQDLIKDGVQAINDEFLEWFVKNPSCEKVDVKYKEVIQYGNMTMYDHNGDGSHYFCKDCEVETSRSKEELLKFGVEYYKIIIPKEEQTKCYCGHTTYCDCGLEEAKQETLEEAARRHSKIHPTKDIDEEERYYNTNCKDYDSFKEGAKRQQERSYSEEEMLNFAWFLLINVGQYSDDRIAHFEGKYLEQFKNK